MEYVSQLIVAHPYYVLLPLAIFEGPIVSFVSGFLIAHGNLDAAPTIAILLLGDFVPDMVAYGIGRFGASRPWVKHYVERTGAGNHFDRLKFVWTIHPIKTMALAKLAYGLSSPFLVSAGLVALPWRKFAVLALVVAVVQRISLLLLGSYLGGYSRTVSDTLQVIEIIVAAGIVAAIGYYVLSHVMRARLLDETRRETEAKRQ